MLHRGLLVGRFQPFHLGHLAAVKSALKLVEQLVIVVGSADRSHEMRNPFTAGERIEMIRSSIDADNEIEISRIFIIPVPDTNVHALWASQVNLLVPKYQIVFSNDPLTSILFRERGIRVVRARLHTRRLLSATEIRSRIVKDDRWKTLVTTETLKVMEEVGGVERIKALSARKTNESHINR